MQVEKGMCILLSSNHGTLLVVPRHQDTLYGRVSPYTSHSAFRKDLQEMFYM